jgi:hypothetical protein
MAALENSLLSAESVCPQVMRSRVDWGFTLPPEIWTISPTVAPTVWNEDAHMTTRRAFVKQVGAGLLAAASAMSVRQAIAAEATTGAPASELKPGEIQHMVIFCLKYDKNAPETLTFIKDGKRILRAIPGVRNFQAFAQVSTKNDYDFGFSMVFSSRADYEKYNTHPDHVGFVEQRWKKEVSRFLEIDFVTQAS